MLFYALIATVVLVTILAAYFSGRNGYGAGDAFMGGFFGFILSAVVAFLLIAIPASTIPMQMQSYETFKYDLRSMGTSSTIEGRISGGIFVTSGYVNQRQVFSYLRDDGNGGVVLRQANADDAVIYEDSDNPTVEFFTVTYGLPALYPWTTTKNQEFKFHVPQGSVSSEIAVTP